MGKIKLFIESEKGKDILIVLIVILVGLGSFELGRLSKEESTNGLKIDYTAQEANILGSFKSENTLKKQNTLINQGILEKTQEKSLKNGNYFASSRGKKYYSIGCGAGKSIKQENRIYFSTAQEAEQSGYTLSTACK